jgi:ATP-dependent exoDNAse (exonuclease V) beta subunit
VAKLIPLIDNALSGQDDFGDKGTLMIVGDPKQSIYRWRGGKAEQFIELSKDKIRLIIQIKNWNIWIKLQAIHK